MVDTPLIGPCLDLTRNWVQVKCFRPEFPLVLIEVALPNGRRKLSFNISDFDSSKSFCYSCSSVFVGDMEYNWELNLDPIVVCSKPRSSIDEHLTAR